MTRPLEGMVGPPGPAYGDTISGTNLAGGTAAALLKRERWVHGSPINPVVGLYATSDGRYISFVAGELELVANPVQFDMAAPISGPAPGFAEQTDEILMELGFDWGRIIELKTIGAVT